MNETCIYRIDCQYRSSVSFAFDELHVIKYVKAKANIWGDELEQLCREKISGFYHLNSFAKVNIIDLV